MRAMEVISKAKANNSTNPEEPFFQRKKSCPGWDSNPSALPTELPGQLNR